MSDTYIDNSQNREAYAEQWQVMNDFMNYEVNIGFFAPLSAKMRYLPATDGVFKDMTQTADANAQARATWIYTQYHRYGISKLKGFLRKAVNGAKNTIHRQPATYELHKDFEYLRESATDRNETLEELHQGITQRQCLYSRGGYLVEVDYDEATRDSKFFITSYDPQRILEYGYDKVQKRRS